MDRRKFLKGAVGVSAVAVVGKTTLNGEKFIAEDMGVSETGFGLAPIKAPGSWIDPVTLDVVPLYGSADPILKGNYPKAIWNDELLRKVVGERYDKYE
jgi:hypothetical protein